MLTQNLFQNQIAHVNDGFNSERVRLKPAILEISNSLKMLGLLLQLTINIEIAFDSLTVLENCSLNQDFLKWIFILLQNQKCCVIYGVFSFKKRCQTRRLYLVLHFYFCYRNHFHFLFKKTKIIMVCQNSISSQTLPAQMTLLFFSVTKDL